MEFNGRKLVSFLTWGNIWDDHNDHIYQVLILSLFFTVVYAVTNAILGFQEFSGGIDGFYQMCVPYDLFFSTLRLPFAEVDTGVISTIKYEDAANLKRQLEARAAAF